MDSETKIEIFGGNVQILPKATQAVQNFYGSSSMAERELGPRVTDHPKERELLSRYVSERKLDTYLAMIGNCQKAAEMGRIIVRMMEEEPALDEKTIVRKDFLALLLPFVTKFTRGASVDTVRYHVNEALAERHRKRLGHGAETPPKR